VARLPRLSVTGYAHLILWRGHNGQPIALDDTDRQALVDALLQQGSAEGVAVHGFALLEAAVWLLLTPQRDGALARAMQGIGRRYVRAFNQRHGRSGTLWEGRYRASVLAPEQVLPALLLLDHEPVWAQLAPEPAGWPWSSHRHYIGEHTWRGLQAPPAWWALGDTPFAREAAYRQRVQQGLTAAQRTRFYQAVRGGWPVGDTAFLQQLQALTGRRVQPAQPGRPRKCNDLSPINSAKSWSTN
jgi:putative transposase